MNALAPLVLESKQKMLPVSLCTAAEFTPNRDMDGHTEIYQLMIFMIFHDYLDLDHSTHTYIYIYINDYTLYIYTHLFCNIYRHLRCSIVQYILNLLYLGMFILSLIYPCATQMTSVATCREAI